jgi:hypothetical protein
MKGPGWYPRGTTPASARAGPRRRPPGLPAVGDPQGGGADEPPQAPPSLRLHVEAARPTRRFQIAGAIPSLDHAFFEDFRVELAG